MAPSTDHEHVSRPGLEVRSSKDGKAASWITKDASQVARMRN